MTHLLFDETGVWGPDLAGRTQHGGSQAIYQRRGGVLPRQRPQPLVTEVQEGASMLGTDDTLGLHNPMDGKVVQTQRSDWQVTVAETRHCQPHLHSVAYRLDAAGGSVVYSGDTAPTPRLTKLAQGADVLLHMCHFINGDEADPRMTEACSGHLDAGPHCPRGRRAYPRARASHGASAGPGSPRAHVRRGRGGVRWDNRRGRRPARRAHQSCAGGTGALTPAGTRTRLPAG